MPGGDGLPRRLLIVGNSGSGKSTMAAKAAAALGCDHVELDSIHHLEDWTPIERDEMRRIVSRKISGDSWVVDGNYASMVQDLVLATADTVVWLDLPRRTVMPRVIRRTLGRMVFRRELWNGNRERPSNLIKRDPYENIILWSWTQQPKYRAQYERIMGENSHLDWVRIRSAREQRRWLESLLETARSPRRSGGSK